MLNPEAIIISIVVSFLLTPKHAFSTLEPFETSLYGKIQGQATNEFINISRNLLKEDKNITFYRTLKMSKTTPEIFQEHIANKGVIFRNNNMKFHYDINENNRKANANNHEATPSMANIKHVKASSPGTLTPTTSGISSTFFERVELQESLTDGRADKLLLHRNKRYLLFPDGTSFQLVFDLIIPIVDYTNYAIMGITCAVAWELPSKPPSEIIENFQHKLNDGTFGLSRRNDSTQQQLKYITSQQDVRNEGEIESKQPKQQLSATVATTSAHENFKTNALKQSPLPSRNLYYNNIQHNEYRPPTPLASATSFFYNKHPQHIKWHNYNMGMDDNDQSETLHHSDNGRPMHQYHTQYSITKTKTRQHQQLKPTQLSYDKAGAFWSKENWWEHNKNRIEKQWHENQQKWSSYQKNQQNTQTPNMFSQRTGRNRKVLKTPPKHRIYPVFGKRRKRSSSVYRNPSLNTMVDKDELSKKLEQIHTREHLHTRQKLYGKIEKLYKTRGHNGTACVLLALCETEKIHLNARHSVTPQSFVMELLRSIFALPNDVLTNAKDPLLQIDVRYSDAVMSAQNGMSQSCSQQFDGCEYGISYDMQL